jgi:hypothetical protein
VIGRRLRRIRGRVDLDEASEAKDLDTFFRTSTPYMKY